MKTYTLYNNETYEIINTIHINDLNYFDLNTNKSYISAIEGDFSPYYYTINSDHTVSRKPDFNETTTIVTLSTNSSDNDYTTFFRNIPNGTEVSINNEIYVITDTKLELLYTIPGEHEIQFINNNYTLSSLNFKITAYEN